MRMTKDRRLSLKKSNPVEVVVIHVVAVEFFRGRGRTDGAPKVADVKWVFVKRK